MKRLIATLALAAVALAAAACAPANAETGGTPAPTAAVDGDSPVVVAQGIQFQTKDVTARAGKAFALKFQNEDSAPHNVSIYTDSSASKRVFEGEIFAQGERVYQVPALTAGTYFFRCDVHPDMTGTLTVE